ncbi:MAG: hypothetical protein ACRC7N_16835 [Clostridium sp.]
MELYAKLFVILAFIRVFVSLFNLNRKKLMSYAYDYKRFEILDDKYYKILFISDVVLCILITGVSLISLRIDNVVIYCVICFILIVAIMGSCRRISLRNGYIKKLT